MSEHTTYRINVTLSGPTATQFTDALRTTRIQEIEQNQLVITSASKLAATLIQQALSEPSLEGVRFSDKTVNFQEKRNRFNIVFYPRDVEQLIKHGFTVEKGLKVDVSIHKTQSEV